MNNDNVQTPQAPHDEAQTVVKKTSRSGFSATKAGGYAAQKRYRQNHPDRVREQARKRRLKNKVKDLRSLSLYEPKLRIPLENKPTFERLLAETGMNITQLCLSALEEKYGVTLQKTDKNA